MHAVLDALQALGDRTQAPRKPFDVGGGGNVEGAERELLSLGGALSRVEGPADLARSERVVE